jgi:hemerythrin-like domain-containing protein
MMAEAYNKVKEAACAYEKDDYQDHTLESYMKENAALAAALAAKAMEEGYGEVKETELTQEMYEAACNEIKDAYAKKIDEMKEAWGAE